MILRRLLIPLAWGLLCAACQRPPEPPSILWIVVDTLRADHLEWYGYGRSTSPGLRPLIDEGILFENAYTPQPETTPAIASMFTGLYPARHGVHSLYLLLHGRNRTVAELLAEAGYETAGFVSSFVMIRNFSNLSQGFATYDDFVTERELYRENYERRAAETVALAHDWLLAHDGGQRPFFLFIHLIDPHGPYAPPGGLARRFRSRDVVPVAGEIPSYQQIPGVRDLNRYRDQYDGEIAYADQALRRLLDVLRQRDRFDKTLILFTADHGESMGEHGLYFQHGSDVFEENVRVPLVIKPPRDLGGRPRRVADAVSHVDLLPTVLAAAGLKAPQGLDGRDLTPFLRGDAQPPVPVFMSTAGPVPSFVAMVMGTRKTLFRRDVHGEWLGTFELAADPQERAPAAVEDQDAAHLRTQQRLWAQTRLPFTVANNFLAPELRGEFIRRHMDRRTREDVQRLRSLGYIE
jgi:arylsulfatase A-like enzyme